MKFRKLFGCWGSASNSRLDEEPYGEPSGLSYFYKGKDYSDYIPFKTFDDNKDSFTTTVQLLNIKTSIDSSDSGYSSCPTVSTSQTISNAASRTVSTDLSHSCSYIPFEQHSSVANNSSVPSIYCEDEVENSEIFAHHDDGIEGTNVSIADLQDLIVESFGPNALLSTNITFRILGDGAGFNSKVVLAENIWDSKELAFLNGWPSSMAIKIATLVKRANSTTMEHDVAKLKRFYEVETVVYRFLESLRNGKAIRMYGCETFAKRNKGILLLEYVRDASYLNLWESMTEPDLIKMLKELAHLHAFTPRMDESYFIENGQILNNIFFERLSDEGIVSRLSDAKGFLKDNELYHKLEVFTEKLRPLSRKLYEKAEELGLPQVFGHGDIWSGNVLYQKRSYKSLIDYQTCHFLHLGAEFGRMFAYMVGKEERQNFEKYMDMYLEELSTLWPEHGITKEELMTSWELLFPFHYLISIFTRCLFCKEVAEENEAVFLKVKSIVSNLLQEASDGLELILAKYEF